MLTGGTHRSKTLRLVVAAFIACTLIPGSALANASGSASSLSSVSIQIPPSADGTSDGWESAPLIANLVPQGPGIMMYRFGAAPGPWDPYLGPVVIPPGKQTMSAVLMAPDGTAGPIATVTVRSDVNAAAARPSSTGPSSATYTGASSTAGSVAVSILVERQVGTLIRRLGGDDRYDTAAIISGSAPTHGDTVIIATGQKFPDALTASGLAGCLNASVLLVTKNSIPPKTSAEIKRLGAKRAVICGGTPSVSAAVQARLRHMGLSVTRLAGKTRYETAIVVAKRIQKLTGRHDRVFVARGDQFYDALIVAPLAYSTRTPILLSTLTKLRKTTAAQLSAAHYSQATIVGSALNQVAENSIRARVPAVERWSGTNQYDTAVQVAAASVLSGQASWGYVGIARGDIFPDALCGGVLAGKERGVILLTPSARLDDTVENALEAHTADVRRIEIYGSENAVGGDIFNEITSLMH